jgi:hypothetical protein
MVRVARAISCLRTTVRKYELVRQPVSHCIDQAISSGAVLFAPLSSNIFLITTMAQPVG